MKHNVVSLTCRGVRLHNCLILPTEMEESNRMLDAIQKDEKRWKKWLREIGRRAGVKDSDRGHVVMKIFTEEDQ